MSTDGPSFPSRDELLGGLPARRASTTLFAIEARTAHLVSRSKRAMAWYETPRSSGERERAFLEAMAGGRSLPTTPSIQDLERFAPRWADLVPARSDLRAALARLLAQKYPLPMDRVPRVRAALGLDEREVAEAFERLHHAPVTSIYATRLSAVERVRWIRAAIVGWLENLAPFWSAYALALTETIGEGILVIPIALAGVGPLPGIALLVVFGIVNLLTMCGLAEAITRNGEMRYGTTYFGRLASSLLGRGGSVAVTSALFAFNVVCLIAYFLAFAAPLAEASGVHLGIWVAVLFIVNLFYLRRDLNSTVASAIVIGAVNLGIVAVISSIALAHADMDNLTYSGLPVLGGDAGNAALGVAFGVTLVAYFGHTSAGNVAKIILAREPTGRALFRGNLAAVVTVIAVYSLAVLGINGAVPAERLIGYAGTALEPLADEVGASVVLLGIVYVTLAIGLGSIYVSLGLYNQVREWIPRPSSARDGGRRHWRDVVSTQRGAAYIPMLPVVLVFFSVEALILADAASVTDPLSLIGSLTVPLLGGVFPILLLLAARRRGEYVPASRVRVLRGPVSIGLVAAVYLAGLLVQGLVIWQRPGERVAAVAVVIIATSVAAVALFRGAFRPRAVIEVRREATGEGNVSVTVAGDRAQASVEAVLRDGRPTAGGVRVERFRELRSVSVRLEPDGVRELKVWIHGITADAETEPIPSMIRVDGGEPVATEGLAAMAIDGTDLAVEVVPGDVGR